MDKNAVITDLVVRFDCDNAKVEIGAGKFKGYLRIGEDCRVTIADGVTCTGPAVVTAAEGTEIIIGRDCMLSTDVTIRSHDSHPIFDVKTEQRVNASQSIVIGEHVWLCAEVTIMGGVEIGNGSVIGTRSLVTRSIPNNTVAVGIPAKVVKRDIAWERPHLTGKKPFYKPDASAVRKSQYWDTTV